MDNSFISHHVQTIRSLSAAELQGAPSLYEKMTIARDGDLRVCYAPFDHVNTSARLVLIGITPGKTQMLNAIREARLQLDKGAGEAEALAAAKRTAAFSGDMRPNLVEMLNFIGLHQWLGVSTCGELFQSKSDLVHTTSALRNPVFNRDQNYNGTPSMTKHPLLQRVLIETLGDELRNFPEAVYVPLGDKVLEALLFLANQGIISRSQILGGLPHPSSANNERIFYFVGRKERAALSVKTNADKLDMSRDSLLKCVAQLA